MNAKDYIDYRLTKLSTTLDFHEDLIYIQNRLRESNAQNSFKMLNEGKIKIKEM
jgi:hypothetical protein